MSKDGIEKIYEAEQSWMTDPDYENFCKAVSLTDPACDDTYGYQSITQYFQTELDTNSLTEADVDGLISLLATDDSQWDIWKGLIGADYERTGANPSTTRLRSFYLYSTPFEGFNDANDRRSEQAKLLYEWEEEHYSQFREEATDEFEVLILS